MLRFKTRNYFFLGLILALIIIFHYFGWLNFIEQSAKALIIPISTKITHWRVSSQDFFGSYFSDKGSLVANYDKCLAKNLNTDISEVKIKDLEQENNELRKQLGFFHRRNFTHITANVVGLNSDNVEKMIIINAGERDGLKNDQPVIAGDGVIVGTIAKVEKDISMVRLINDNQSKVAATLLNKDGSLGVVEGGYGLSIKMNFIPRNEVVLVGDQVITSGLEENIPRGLLIGEVAVAENEAYQPFQQAVLTPAIDLSKLFTVSVLIAN
jgi:rod shape-determining protein MreC